MATIIAISRQFGSGGAWVGRAVAQRLGFQYADREILAEAARRLQLDAADLEPLEERTASVWERIGTLFALGAPDTPFIPPTLPVVTEASLFAVQRQVIENIASHGKAVIVGRGAPHVLGGSADVLRVLLHAPFEDRVTLAMSEYGFSDRAEAASVVRSSDAARGKFIESLTGRHWLDSSSYDASLNTSRIGMEHVVDVLVGMIQPGRTQPMPPLSPRTASDREPR